MGISELSREELKILRELAGSLLDELFGPSFTVTIEFHVTEEGKNLFEEAVEKPKETYDRLLDFFKNEVTLKIIMQIVDKRISKKQVRTKGVMQGLIEAMKRDDKEGVVQALRELLVYLTQDAGLLSKI